MNTRQIERCMKSHKPHFVGVYPLDEVCQWTKLPRNDETFGCLIVNMDPSYLPGTHWFALYLDYRKRYAEVFDSYGRLPPLRLQRWLNKLCYRWTYNKRLVQGPLTMLCGGYCIFFLNLRCAIATTTDVPLKEIVNECFTDAFMQNDDMIRRYMLNTFAICF